MKTKPSKADSLKAAASALDISLGVVKRAKQMGCPAFVHGRTDLDVLKQWLAENDVESTDLDGLKIEVLKQDLRRKTAAAKTAEIELGLKENSICLKTEVVERITANISRAVAMLTGKFVSELPARQGGLPADEIAAMNEAALEEVKAEMEKAL